MKNRLTKKNCTSCDEKITKGESYIQIEDEDIFCSMNCWIEYAKQQLGFTWMSNEE